MRIFFRSANLFVDSVYCDILPQRTCSQFVQLKIFCLVFCCKCVSGFRVSTGFQEGPCGGSYQKCVNFGCQFKAGSALKRGSTECLTSVLPRSSLDRVQRGAKARQSKYGSDNGRTSALRQTSVPCSGVDPA